MSEVSIDDMDRRLLALLAEDARMSNRRIAAELGVTEGTVRGRIKRLQQDRLIAFTALTDISLASGTTLAFIGVQADVETVRATADLIADMADVNGVMITMGRFNILAICLFGTLDELHDLASDRILALPGVRHVETSIAVRTMKYNSTVVRITSDRTKTAGKATNA